MSKLSTQKQPAPRPTRREFIINDVDDCPHPDNRRTYLGHHGPNAFHQCQQCKAIFITIPENIYQQMNEITATDHNSH